MSSSNTFTSLHGQGEGGVVGTPGGFVFFEKLPLASLSELKLGELLELRGAYYSVGDLPTDLTQEALRAHVLVHRGPERDRFVTYGIRNPSGELCVDLPRSDDYNVAVVKVARIVSEDDVPEAALARVKTAEAEANPPAESLEKMGRALEELL